MTLLFIDTNIWLDFYRVHGAQSDLLILERIDENRDRIISTVQVEMEFKKNRPNVILDTYASLKPPNWAGLQLPAYLARSKQSSGLETGRKSIERQLRTLRERTRNVFTAPSRFDPVYRPAQRLFRHASPYILAQKGKHWPMIRRLAFRRFLLGYPPRKNSDTSIGDAINWEWIIHCANQSGEDIVVVSRDSDFGARLEGKVYLNDWLQQEFSERVSRKRRITLTDRLSEGFKVADIQVSQEEEESEEEFLKEKARGLVPTVGPSAHSGLQNLGRILSRWSAETTAQWGSISELLAGIGPEALDVDIPPGGLAGLLGEARRAERIEQEEEDKGEEE